MNSWSVRETVLNLTGSEGSVDKQTHDESLTGMGPLVALKIRPLQQQMTLCVFVCVFVRRNNNVLSDMK